MHTLIAASPDLPNPWDVLAPYGVLGMLVLLLGWLHWSSIQRERKRADDAETRLYALQDQLRAEYVPAMTRMTDAVQQIAHIVPDLVLSRRGS